VAQATHAFEKSSRQPASSEKPVSSRKRKAKVEAAKRRRRSQQQRRGVVVRTFPWKMRFKRTPTTSSRGRPHSKSPPSSVTPAPDKPPRDCITTPTSLLWLSRPLLESKGQRQCAGPLEPCCPSGAESKSAKGGERILSNAWLGCWAGCSRCYFRRLTIDQSTPTATSQRQARASPWAFRGRPGVVWGPEIVRASGRA